MEIVKRTQGCWTCKKRKIGCDRGYPACNNCRRTGRECMGYSIRLAWPDQPDGRRRGSRIPDGTVHYSIDRPPNYGEQFLNVTYADLMQSGKGPMVFNEEILLLRSQRRVPRNLPLLPRFNERESHLLRYYNCKLSAMISTIDVDNGFRHDLIPMAFTDDDQASQGLRNAMLAVSAYHLWGSEHALSYKLEAIRLLSSSLSRQLSRTTETQLAISMMLCVYNVFDETEGNWSCHLGGAQNILYQLATIQSGHLAFRFLYTWFLYHEVLGGFSKPLAQYPHGPVSLRLLRETSFDRSVIIGSLGCSIAVMEIISWVNTWRAIELQGDTSPYSARDKSNRSTEWKVQLRNLESLHQRLDPRHEQKLPQQSLRRTLATAELYRLAALLYLHRACCTDTTQESRSEFIKQALDILSSLDVCTSPWPLFVIACESENDEQRITILRTLDRMDEERHIGNVFVLRHIIESFWKQQDLQADSVMTGGMKWWDTVDLNLSAPWFI
ncbi:fungal-specific transcription factor domain-containing protein [Xylariaceae sp. FL0594]|nr:fungal-specific transcription factor domain-containing protein [Xylariaceae sp. FL0594]